MGSVFLGRNGVGENAAERVTREVRNGMKRIVILIDDLNVKAELNESESATKIWDALPIIGTTCTWGEEVFFEIPVVHGLESNAKQEVEVGTLAYWPPGKALCIFFGKTPVSTSGKPKAYSPVNVVGTVLGDTKVFKILRSGDEVRIRKAP